MSSSGISKTQKGQKSPILRVDKPIESEIQTKFVTSQTGNFSLDLRDRKAQNWLLSGADLKVLL